MRLKDEKCLDRFRGRTCEFCKRRGGSVAGHIYPRGSGRVDHPWNVCALCPECEWNHHHNKEPTCAQMKDIVCEREGGILPNDIHVFVKIARRAPKGSRRHLEYARRRINAAKRRRELDDQEKRARAEAEQGEFRDLYARRTRPAPRRRRRRCPADEDGWERRYVRPSEN